MSDQSYFQELAKAGSGKPQSKVGRLEGMGMSERGVYEELVKFGIPKLDAGIITDCLNMEKACMWQNDEDGLQRGRSASSLQNFEKAQGNRTRGAFSNVSLEAVGKVNEFVKGKGLGMKVEASAGRYGKVVWEVRKPQGLTPKVSNFDAEASNVSERFESSEELSKF
ncbi:hypothetical protein COV61_02045 [Candidatus Micrarchaeota archaeon CG11_big_fil_rev_8_21_14_0_20_47_5]|nr:MAG: hypothetical protein AUJ17_02690 [Candidatus Micrarchaeota archaeon CG1_02_47_40]PIN83809.1 MAG: hypothetical protein COV61_02045 [Candidatus Micrarchaeota archaeon CG11_big_fil_rev_8_21_14_0_20_47_5]